MKKVTLRQKLDALAAEGKEIKVTWDGGNDSGSYTAYVGGKELGYGDSLGDAIVDLVGDEIDYGSWAGDYYADGEVCYDADEGAFIGEGKEVTTEYDTSDVSIELRIPKALNFESITIDTEGGSQHDEVRCSFRFSISNGPVFEEHVNLQTEWEEKIQTLLTDFAYTVELGEDSEVEGMYNDWIIGRDHMTEDGDDLVFTIEDVGFSYSCPRYQHRVVTVLEDGDYIDEDDTIQSNPPS